MITITVEAYGAFDESTEKFISIDQSVKLHMENSLFAIAEWEKKYKKPWFPDSRASDSIKKKQSEKTQDEMFYFIKCMITHIDGKKVLRKRLSENNGVSTRFTNCINTYT